MGKLGKTVVQVILVSFAGRGKISKCFGRVSHCLLVITSQLLASKPIFRDYRSSKKPKNVQPESLFASPLSKPSLWSSVSSPECPVRFSLSRSGYMGFSRNLILITSFPQICVFDSFRSQSSSRRGLSSRYARI